VKYGDLKPGQKVKIRAFNKKGEVILWTSVEAVKDGKVHLKGLSRDGSFITFPKDKVNLELSALTPDGKFQWNKASMSVGRLNGSRTYELDAHKEGKRVETKNAQKKTVYIKECTILYDKEPGNSHKGVTRYLSKSKLAFEGETVGEVNDVCKLSLFMDGEEPIVVEGKILRKTALENRPNVCKYEFALTKPDSRYFQLVEAI